MITLKLKELLETDATPSISREEDKTIKQIFNAGEKKSTALR